VSNHSISSGYTGRLNGQDLDSIELNLRLTDPRPVVGISIEVLFSILWPEIPVPETLAYSSLDQFMEFRKSIHARPRHGRQTTFSAIFKV
jgi:hypothetical protein